MRWNCIITERSSGQIYFVWNDCTNLIGLPEGGRDRFVSDRHNGSWDFSSSLDVVHFFWPTSTIRLWRSVLIFFVLSAERQRTFQSRTPVLNERWPFCKTDRAGNERSGREGRVGTEWSAGERERRASSCRANPDSAEEKRDAEGPPVFFSHILFPIFFYDTKDDEKALRWMCARRADDCVCAKIKPLRSLSLSTASSTVDDGTIDVRVGSNGGGNVNYYIDTPHCSRQCV